MDGLFSFSRKDRPPVNKGRGGNGKKDELIEWAGMNQLFEAPQLTHRSGAYSSFVRSPMCPSLLETQSPSGKERRTESDLSAPLYPNPPQSDQPLLVLRSPLLLAKDRLICPNIGLYLPKRRLGNLSLSWIMPRQGRAQKRLHNLLWRAPAVLSTPSTRPSPS